MFLNGVFKRSTKCRTQLEIEVLLHLVELLEPEIEARGAVAPVCERKMLSALQMWPSLARAGLQHGTMQRRLTHVVWQKLKCGTGEGRVDLHIKLLHSASLCESRALKGFGWDFAFRRRAASFGQGSGTLRGCATNLARGSTTSPKDEMEYETRDDAWTLVGRGPHPLDKLFRPRSVVVIGASEKQSSLGRSVIQNLLSKESQFKGEIALVSRSQPQVFGRPTFSRLDQVTCSPEVALILTPAAGAVEVLRELRRSTPSVRCAVLYGTDFDSVDSASGRRYISLALEEARAGKLRLLGPNTLGVLNDRGLCALFGPRAAYTRGRVALVSNSGALLCALLDWSRKEQFGFSLVTSLGRMADINFGDLIAWLGADDHTDSIVIHMEAIGDVRSFISAAREVALTKPIVVLKSLRSETEAQKVRESGFYSCDTSLAPIEDDLLDEITRRSGVLRVDTLEELFLAARIIAQQPMPAGNRLSIVTNAGGAGVLAVDELSLHGECVLAAHSPATTEALKEQLPEGSSVMNPVDIAWEDVTAHHYSKAVRATLTDANSDGTLVILTPQAFTDAVEAAREVAALAPLSRRLGKTLLASWMGGIDVAPAQLILRDAGVPNFAFADVGVRAFNYLYRYRRILANLYEVPDAATLGRVTAWRDAKMRARRLVDAARRPDEEAALSELDANRVLDLYRVPVLASRAVSSLDEAVVAALDIKFPLVFRAQASKSSTPSCEVLCNNVPAVRNAWHSVFGGEDVGNAGAPPMATLAQYLSVKSDRESSLDKRTRTAGGALADGVFEVVLRSRVHPRVGPIVEVGSCDGILEDMAVALPPLSVPLSRQAMERTKIYGAIRQHIDKMSHHFALDAAKTSSGWVPSSTSPSSESSTVHSAVSASGTITAANNNGTSTSSSGAIGRLRSSDSALAKLESIVACFSRLVTEQPVVQTALRIIVDTRPPSASTVLVARAQIKLVPSNTAVDSMPSSVIRGYPSELVTMWAGDSMGTPPVTFRVVRPEDEPIVRRFYRRVTAEKEDPKSISPVSVAKAIKAVATESCVDEGTSEEARPADWVKDRVVNLCHGDYSTKLTLIAEARNRESGMLEILGLGQLLLHPRRVSWDSAAAEIRADSSSNGSSSASVLHTEDNDSKINFSVVVLSHDRSPGLRIELLRRIVQMARGENIPRISSVVHKSNEMLIRTCKMLGFTLEELSDGRVRVSLSLVRAKKPRTD